MIKIISYVISLILLTLSIPVIAQSRGYSNSYGSYTYSSDPSFSNYSAIRERRNRERREAIKAKKEKEKEEKSKESHSFELSSAFLTHHFSHINADRFANKVSKDGRTINNPLYSLSFLSGDKKSYGSFNLYGGQDSIGSPMHGFMLSKGIGAIDESGVQIGGIWGLYFYNEKNWEKKFHDRPEQTPSWLRATYGDSFRGVNMIIGLEINAQLMITEGAYLKLRNVITPMITIHSIGIGFNY